MGIPSGDDADPWYELLGPPSRRGRKLQCLTLFDPSPRMYHQYRLGLADLIPIRTFWPVNLRDARRVAHSFREDEA